MAINETGRTGPLLPNTPVTPAWGTQPTTAPADVQGGGDAPSIPQDQAGGDNNVNRLRAAGAAPHAAALPWDAVKAAKSAADTFKDQLASQKQWQNRATTAASVLAIGNDIGKVNKSLDKIENGQYVSGTAGLVSAVTDGSSAALTGFDALRGSKQFKGLALELKVSSGAAGSVAGIANGIQEFKDGHEVEGATHIAGAAAGGASAAISVAGMVAKEGSALKGAAGALGKFVAPLGVAGAMADGVVGIEKGVQQMTHGHVMEGLGTAAKGALDAVSSGSYMASVLPGGSAAIKAFGKAAGPLGAAAGVASAGIEVYHAMSSHPPNYEAAAVGSAKAAGSALLMTPPPGNIAGGAILIGAALYENRKAIGHAAVEVAHEASHAAHVVAHEASHVAHAVAHEAQHVAQAVRSEATHVVHAVEQRATQAVHAVEHEVAHVAHEAVDTAKNAVKNVGHFFSSLW